MKTTSMKTIIIADDLGLVAEDDAIILTAAAQGLLDGVSVMATSPCFEDISAELGRVSGVSIGLHFNLTEGIPVNSGGNGSSLTAPLTRFDFDENRLPESIAAMVTKADQDDLFRHNAFAELTAQLEKFTSYLGPPDFVNYHHHLHLAHTWFDEAMVMLAQTAGSRWARGWVVPMVGIFETPSHERSGMHDRRRIAGLEVVSSYSNVREPLGFVQDNIEADTYLQELFSTIREDLSSIPASDCKVAEIVVHPGNWRVGDSYGWIRTLEREMLQRLTACLNPLQFP